MPDLLGDFSSILEKTYFNNTVLEYLLAFAFLLIGFGLIKAFKSVFLKQIKRFTSRKQNSLQDFLVESVERFGLPALFITIAYLSLTSLTLPAKLLRVLEISLTISITILAIRFLSTTIQLLLQSFLKSRTYSEEKVKQLGGIMLIINIVIWFVGIIFLFDNMGYNVTTVVAGLGIGGIAVALAAQNILGDLFNYFVIFLDRPFEVGDFIIIDDKLGVVENIGIKTTRVKSLSGEQLVFSNSDLTNSRIHNYKRMERRRVVFKIKVTYQTPFDKIQLIPGLLKSIVLEQHRVEFDRAHFAAYGDSSLDYEVVYYVLSSDYTAYMDVQQAINFRIFEQFQSLGIKFAHPIRTLYIANGKQDRVNEDAYIHA
ncbi:mechanosensitive ion channel family protein [Pontibacter beigongshangensis]|uniref:mechanosensitive ion channel family protein n=1 Tax=Pontibacter beigongshangensis TaxID=2574733 RepID=UPI001650137D|nr:mechanosensitive ion channel family protein [Pontibacter beigongshangensis]